MCGGKSQSPINIDTCMVSTDAKLPPLQFGEGFKEMINGKLENNGHTGTYWKTTYSILKGQQICKGKCSFLHAK
jgi:carbonic anhydrase